MSAKRYCLVPSRWTDEEIAARSCASSSHAHLSRSQVYALERDGVIEWILQPACNREKGIVRLRISLPSRGLSARVGSYLAEAIRSRQLWAQVMLSEMQRKRLNNIVKAAVE